MDETLAINALRGIALRNRGEVSAVNGGAAPARGVVSFNIGLPWEVEVILDHTRADLRQALAFESNGIVELERLQEQLDQLRNKLFAPAAERASSPLGSHEAAEAIREILRYRRRRERIFGNDLFGEPAWDILLELYLAELTYKKMSVSAACLASAVPATTALRWISTLEKKGLIMRRNDPMDRRRVWLCLTPQGSSAMQNYLTMTVIQPAN